MKVISDESYKLLIQDKVSNDEFLKLNDINENEIGDSLYKMISISIEKSDSTQLAKCIYVIFQFKIFNNKFVELLNKAIICDWHKQHENLAMLLQKIKSPSSIEPLFLTANKQFKYLDYDEFFALAVKCIWGLGDIGTKDAYKKLIILSESDNKIIAKNAIKQLGRIKEKV